LFVVLGTAFLRILVFQLILPSLVGLVHPTLALMMRVVFLQVKLIQNTFVNAPLVFMVPTATKQMLH
jgi:hypothetical protein